MITDSELETLAEFGKETSGEYCDRWQFSICPRNKERTDWELRLFCEVDGSTWHVKYLKDIEDLKNVYHAISDSELVFFKYFATDGRGFVEEEECTYYQSILDGKIRECETCYNGTLYVKRDTVTDESLIVDDLSIGRLRSKSVEIKCVDCDGVGHFEIKQENDRSS